MNLLDDIAKVGENPRHLYWFYPLGLSPQEYFRWGKGTPDDLGLRESSKKGQNPRFFPPLF